MTWPQQYLQEHFIWHFGSNSKFWSLIKVKCLEVWACSSTNFDPMFVWTKYDWVYLTQKLGFKCTSSSYQLHCPPCNIMPPGVVNWNPRKESRHSRNFFVEVITVILQTVSFEINKQSINPTYLNLGHAKALVRTLSANRLNDRNNHIC